MTDGNGREGIIVSTFKQAVSLSDDQIRFLGVRTDLPIIWVDDDFSRWHEHRGLHIVSFGNVVPEGSSREGLRIRSYGDSSGIKLTLVITLQCVEVEGFEPYGEIRWREGDADISLTRVNLNRPLTVLEPVRKALRVAVALQVSRRGRRKGWRKGREWTRREILEWYVEAAEEYARDGSRPLLRDLGDAMGVSEDTASKRVTETGLHWPPTQEELDELDEA